MDKSLPPRPIYLEYWPVLRGRMSRKYGSLCIDQLLACTTCSQYNHAIWRRGVGWCSIAAWRRRTGWRCCILQCMDSCWRYSSSTFPFSQSVAPIQVQNVAHHVFVCITHTSGRKRASLHTEVQQWSVTASVVLFFMRPALVG